MRCRPRSRETVTGPGSRSQSILPSGLMAWPRTQGGAGRARAVRAAHWPIMPLPANLARAGYSAPELGWYTPRGVVEKARFRS